jgi:hypothetical protein
MAVRARRVSAFLKGGKVGKWGAVVFFEKRKIRKNSKIASSAAA